MFILRDLLRTLQAHFSETDLGRERASLFVYTLLAVIVPFTSSMSSNLWRALVTLFGIEIERKPFLYLHGVIDAALAEALVDVVALDSVADDRRSLVDRFG